jgi:hypothetical protein
MISIDFSYDGKLDGMDEAIKLAIAKKLTELTTILHSKVVENVSGKILQKQSGQLASSIRQEVDVGTNPMVGLVFPDPADDKAWALERGGKGYYDIVASKAQLLHFFTKGGVEVFTKSVHHPPSREFAYLRTALEEMTELVPQGFAEAIQTVLAGNAA